MDIDFDGYKRKRTDKTQKLRGNTISGIAKDMKEHEKKHFESLYDQLRDAYTIADLNRAYSELKAINININLKGKR